MKYKGQGKKECVVMKFDDYDNQWREYTVPVTIGQATKILIAKRENKNYRIEYIKKDK